MVPKRTFRRRFIFVISLCAFFTLGFLRLMPTALSRSARLEADLDGYFAHHELLQMNTQTVAQKLRKTGHLSLATAEVNFEVDLQPHDLRASNYRAEEFGSENVGHRVDVGPIRTFKGHARVGHRGNQLQEPGEARFTIDETRVEGLIITPSEHYFVEPAKRFSEAALSDDYVIYKESEVVAGTTAECGVTLSEQVNQRAEAVRVENAQAISKAQPNSIEVRNEDNKGGANITPAAPDCATEPISNGQPLNRTLDT